jgi:hypothetical protein
MGGESFFFGPDAPIAPPPPAVRFSKVRCDGVSLPPTDSARLQIAQLPMEEILRMYATDPPPGKSWMLYQDETV